jgi:hypothetical protein
MKMHEVPGTGSCKSCIYEKKIEKRFGPFAAPLLALVGRKHFLRPLLYRYLLFAKPLQFAGVMSILGMHPISCRSENLAFFISGIRPDTGLYWRISG